MPYGWLFGLGVSTSMYRWLTGSKRPIAETRRSVYQSAPVLNARSHGPLPIVTGHWPTTLPARESNSPIMLLFGVVNQTFPKSSGRTKAG